MVHFIARYRQRCNFRRQRGQVRDHIPLWNLANHGVNSTSSRVQNATIYVNGEEVAPIVRL